MQPEKIKNVVFDIGNVLVRWAPEEIVRLTFADSKQADALAKTLFHGDIWLDLNRGLMTEEQAKLRYQQQHGLSQLESEKLFYYVKQSLIPLYGSQELLRRVKQAGYGVYALTDNVHEIVDYLQVHYDFWPLFDGATVSAELGLLKPEPEIYQSLLETHRLCRAKVVMSLYSKVKMSLF
ncbi:HAD family hydrolase [Vibrio sp. WXL210]|uniref:HAD family hydrolase n=1 Tax=Vibrio sp. WXL210 TaxID=3450709 RepID=UPI003EC6C775